MDGCVHYNSIDLCVSVCVCDWMFVRMMCTIRGERVAAPRFLRFFFVVDEHASALLGGFHVITGQIVGFVQ